MLIHEERVERHCAGIEEVIENMGKEFISMQDKLVEMADQNKSDILNLEMAFNTATKSLKWEFFEIICSLKEIKSYWRIKNNNFLLIIF